MRHGGVWKTLDPSVRAHYLERLNMTDVGHPADFVAVAVSEARKQCIVLRKGTTELRAVHFRPDAPTVPVTKITHAVTVATEHRTETEVTTMNMANFDPTETATELGNELAYERSERQRLQRENAVLQESLRAERAHSASQENVNAVLQTRVHQEQEARMNADAENARLRADHADALRRANRRSIAILFAGGIAVLIGVAGYVVVKRPSFSEEASPPALKAPQDIPMKNDASPPKDSRPIDPAVAEWLKKKEDEIHPPNFRPEALPGRDDIARLIAEQQRVRLTPVLKGKLTWKALEAMGVTLDRKDGVRLLLSGDDGTLSHIDPHERAEVYLDGDDMYVLQKRPDDRRRDEHRTMTLDRYSPKKATVESLSVSATGDWKDPMIFTIMKWPDTPLLLRPGKERLPVPDMKVSAEARKILRECGYGLEVSAGAVHVTGPGSFKSTSPVLGADGVTVEAGIGRVEATFVADAGFGYVHWQRYIISPTEGLRIDSRTVRQLSPRAHPPQDRVRPAQKQEEEDNPDDLLRGDLMPKRTPEQPWYFPHIDESRPNLPEKKQEKK